MKGATEEGHIESQKETGWVCGDYVLICTSMAE
jgi:hypothetical protein